MPPVFPPRFTYPLAREVRFNTRLNRMADWREYRATELATPLLRWELDLEPLEDTDLASLEAFFNARGGPYESFVFLDPLDNLLQWSEDFTQAAWQKTSPADLQITPGVADPLGGTAAQTLSNTGAASNAVRQFIAAPPAGITFTGSVWLKASGASLTLRLTDTAAEAFSRTVTPGPQWSRFHLTATFASSGTQVGWEIEIPPGATVEAFGAQMVAAKGPDGYTRTTTVSGFHPTCRFETETFTHRALGPNVNQARLAIVEHQ